MLRVHIECCWHRPQHRTRRHFILGHDRERHYDEGSFTGKGIYEVDILQQVLAHRFPRNALLSHDLIECIYARAGLSVTSS